MASKKLVKGWGINDADYVVKVKTAHYDESGKRRFKEVWSCPFYAKWLSLLDRGVNKKYAINKPSYLNASVNIEWKYFTQFKSWMEKKKWEGLQLDKDILLPGNKEYGPNTCCFVPGYINTLIVVGGSKTGLPIGLTYHHTQKDGTKVYTARVSDENKKCKRLGDYTDVKTAHKAWQIEKARVIEEVVAIYAKDSCFDSHVADALLARVWKLRLDAHNGVETTQL